MNTILIKKTELEKAAKMLREGKLVAFPTETVYGLGANILDTKAVKSVFKAKKRPYSDPLIVHCDSFGMVNTVAYMSPQALKLAKAFWPGPLTMVLPKKDVISKYVNAGRESVAVRIPSNAIAKKLIKLAGIPIAAPSANLFTKTSPTAYQHVLDDLNGRIDAIVMGDQSKVGVESTVVDMTSEKPRVLRPGGISFVQLRKVLKTVQPHVAKSTGLAPGEYKYHYKPKAQVVLIKSLLEVPLHDQTVGVMVFSEWLPKIKASKSHIYHWGSKNHDAKLASNLYAGLRELDKKKVKVIYCPLPAKKGLGEAVLNRLMKASVK